MLLQESPHPAFDVAGASFQSRFHPDPGEPPDTQVSNPMGSLEFGRRRFDPTSQPVVLPEFIGLLGGESTIAGELIVAKLQLIGPATAVGRPHGTLLDVLA